jgi:DNA repair protein RadC
MLRTGIRGKSACGLARELLQRFGGLRGLYSVQDSELMQVKGLGIAKIAQLRAAIELSKRYIEEELKQESKEFNNPS